MASGKQITVCWHVDDLLVSCEGNFDITRFACYLLDIYGPKLAMHTGNKHNYLGVDMEFGGGKLQASMFDYLAKAIKKFLKVITSSVVTPAVDHLFQV